MAEELLTISNIPSSEGLHKHYQNSVVLPNQLLFSTGCFIMPRLGFYIFMLDPEMKAGFAPAPTLKMFGLFRALGASCHLVTSP